jgi:light-regulated signal transduction histidine kinase (bacteriophytochrome)
LTAVACLTGFVVLGTALSSQFGVAQAAQIMITLLAPATVMILFWRAVRARVVERELNIEAMLDFERASSRALAEFLADVSHELPVHPERCSLRAEALAVAVDYRLVGPRLRVAVPDIVLSSDPHLLRQLLHILVGNALRHGGDRVAIWAATEGDWAVLNVSDDGPGVPPEIAGRLFERLVVLGKPTKEIGDSGTGLSIARTLGDLMGGQITYRRDASWTHFSFRLPLNVVGGDPEPARARLGAGVV